MPKYIEVSDGTDRHLEPIKDLLEVLNRFIPGQFVIAGGYPRDILLGSRFNDVDIFIEQESWIGRNSPTNALKKLREDLVQTGRIDFFTRSEDNTFMEGIFYELTNQDQKIPKYRIQLISWFSTTSKAIASFDFRHCQVFIPFTKHYGIESGRMYAYSQRSLEALSSRSIEITDEYLMRFGHEYGEQKIILLEKIFKRIAKFKKRGFLLGDQTKLALLKQIEDTLKQIETTYARSSFSLDSLDSSFPAKSILLGEATQYELYEIGNREYSIYTTRAVAIRLAKEIHYTLQEHPTSLLLSGSELVRTAGKQLLEKLSN